VPVPAPAAAKHLPPAVPMAVAAPVAVPGPMAPGTPPPQCFTDTDIDSSNVLPPPPVVAALVKNSRVGAQTASHRVFTSIVKNSRTCPECLVVINDAMRDIATKHYPGVDPESFLANRVSCENLKRGVVFVVSWPFTYIGISAFALLYAKDAAALTGAIVSCGIEGSSAAQGAPFGLPLKARWAEMSLFQQAKYIASRNVLRANRNKTAAPADGSW
jgi:hypothetical protein